MLHSPSEKIRFVFVHFDGVVLENILAPITYSVVSKLGGIYSAEIENNVFARSQSHAASFIIRELNLNLSINDIIDLYYKERKQYEESHSIRMNPGVKNFLLLLQSLGYTVVSYGGAPKDYFLKHVKDLAPLFGHEKYIQTKDFRPGVKEIIFNNYGLKPWEALFIDEEFIIAQASKDLLVPFIGMSTGFDYSYQKQEMEKLGVKYLIHSLDEIDSEYLECIQREVTNGKIWTKI